MRIAVLSFALLLAVPSFAGTLMLIARQPDSPVQILRAQHGIPDVLESASFENRSDKVITSYRIGWATVAEGKSSFRAGEWMNVPAGISLGETATVPAQGISCDAQAEDMVFFVSEVKFSDGSRWKAKHSGLTKQ
jgi:hypothetical protein